jgi:hypothetical protein
VKYRSTVKEKTVENIQICSIDPIGFPNIRRSYSWDLDMPPCPVDKPYVSRWYTDQTDYKIVLKDYWIEHAEKIPVEIKADVVVKDIMATEGMTLRGCFIPKGDTPTPEELRNAKGVRRAYMEACIRAGDTEYARSGRIDDIPQEFKRYVAEMKIEREWAYAAKETVDCPACGGQIKYGVAVCLHCKAILDPTKAEAFGLVPKKEEVKVEKPVKVI